MLDTQDYPTRHATAIYIAAAHYTALDDAAQALLARWLADGVSGIGSQWAREILTRLADYCEFTAQGRALVDALKMEVTE